MNERTVRAIKFLAELERIADECRRTYLRDVVWTRVASVCSEDTQSARHSQSQELTPDT